jgi:hypothetical protein
MVVVVLQAILGLMAWSPRPAAALSPPEAPSMRTATARPDDGAGPTPIHVSLYVINVTKLDEQAQSFTGDFYISFSWLDRRLADPSLKHVRVAPLDQIWHPRLLTVNRRTAESAYPEAVEVDPAGGVRYTQRLVGSFIVPLEFRDFPFDSQDLFLEIVAPGYSSGDIAFVVDKDRVGREPDWTLPGWHLSPMMVRPFTREIGFAASGQDLVQLSGVRVEFMATRNWHYYLLREVLPLLFIAFMSSSLFWIPPTEHSMKVGISTAAIFSLMAYYVQLGRALPKIDYLTRMDWLVVGSTIIVFSSFSEVIVGMYLVKRDRMVTVRRMERWSRLLYPSAILIVVAAAFR